jgi:hypothetical protein
MTGGLQCSSATRPRLPQGEGTVSGLLNDVPGAAVPGKKQRCTALVVDSKRYTHSAAKFWPALLDEVALKYPTCDRLELAASSSGPLESRRLYPEIELQESIMELMNADLRQAVHETIAALEILGPPGPVELRLFEKKAELMHGTLPLDSVDAEIFPYLMVWLLKWADIPEAAWNREHLGGEFSAADPRRGLQYEITFTSANRHLSEGLYRRSIALQAVITAAA